MRKQGVMLSTAILFFVGSSLLVLSGKYSRGKTMYRRTRLCNRPPSRHGSEHNTISFQAVKKASTRMINEDVLEASFGLRLFVTATGSAFRNSIREALTFKT